MQKDYLDVLKENLRSYAEENIEFNEPHFSQQLNLREDSKKEVIKNLLNPDKLVYSYQEKGKHNDTIHCLYFKVSNTRTMRLPVISHQKSLYILRYITRYRPWQSMIKRK
ncbi:hypothetical protein GF343_01150 [Candidatus Woesearchaeota archaeon]|nr:hypothetical protein [Candidatus Woesearchaeota archaeon]